MGRLNVLAGVVLAVSILRELVAPELNLLRARLKESLRTPKWLLCRLCSCVIISNSTSY